jgi:hypothetical protein
MEQTQQIAETCEMIGSVIGNACVSMFDSVCWPICATVFTQFMPQWAPALGGLCEGICNACVAPCM